MMKKLTKFPEVKLYMLLIATVNDKGDIVEKLLHNIGPRELIAVEKSWCENSPRKMNIFHSLLSENEEKSNHYRDIMPKVIGLMIDKGGKDLVLKTNEDGQSILHTFAYFKHEELVPIARRIVDIGVESLFMMQDKKDNTILHHLLQQRDIASGYWETLVEIIGLMLDKGGKELVLKTNEDGNTILHKFAYDEKFIPIIKRIVDIGGESLFKIHNEKGDTILHQLLKQSYISSECRNEKETIERNNDEKKQVLELYLDTLADNKEVVIIRNYDGKTALDLALESQNQPCIDVLMELIGKESILNQDAHEVKTVLHKACEKEMYNEIRRFLEIGGKELLMKQDVQGNSALHLLPTCCENHDKQFQCVQDMIKIGGKDLFNCTNKKGNKPSLISQVDQYMHGIQQSLQMKIEQLENQLVLEEKRGQNEIEIVKKWHEERHEETVNCLEKKEIEIQRLEKVETSLIKVIEDQKQMIEKLQKERQQFSEESEKKQQENDALKQEIESLKLQIASLPSVGSITVKDNQSEEEIIVDDFEEVSLSRATNEFHEIGECKVQREKLEKELECSICLDPFEDPHIVPECCHRFCLKCIDTAIKKSGKECPMCRKRISSKRSLRRDELIGKISKLVFSDDKEGDKNKDNLVTETAKAKPATKIQQHKEEVTSMKDKIDSLEEMLKQNASNISQLEKRIAEKDEANLSLKGVITAKHRENNALKQENDTLNRQLSSSLSSKRSRDEFESSDNDTDYTIPQKQSKPHESEASRFYMNEALESENEDLLQQLKKEKTSHSKTIERLENARKKLKEAYHAQKR